MTGFFRAWLVAIRPRTLTLSLAPVLVGAALALAQGPARLAPAAVALVCALCIQIATNLFNDARDFERGGDGPDRLGPPRAAASGLLTPRALKLAAAGCFAVAALGGCFLVALGGWPILALGLLSLFCGWAYSGGPRPISHLPLGELFVIVFFGLGAVGGTYFLCAGRLDAAALIAGLALGCFAAGVLMVNNIRDAAADARNGRRTLAILAGPRMARWIYAGLMAAPFVLLAVLAQPAPHRLLALLAAPLAVSAVRKTFALAPGPEMNALLAATARAENFYALLLCLGALL